MADFLASFDRAIKISGWNRNDDYCIVKIKPRSGCCCFHHWHKVWSEIGNIIEIPDFGNKNEGDILIRKDGEEFVLQCHETGPEFIFGIVCGFAANFLYDVIKIVLKKCIKDDRKIEIICVVFSKNKVKVENTLNIKDVDDIKKEIQKIRKQLNKKTP